MPTMCPGVEYNTLAREWRCNWSEDNDKASLVELQKALNEIMPKLKAVPGIRDVRRIVCGGKHEFKVVMSMPADTLVDWGEKNFDPEVEWSMKVLSIDGVTNFETQTYTTMPVKVTPPPKLKKARNFNISKLNPDSKGMTCEGNVIGEVKEVETKTGSKVYEVTVGDASGQVICSLKDFQKDALKGAKAAILRNAKIIMVNGHVRLSVDKWGKVESSENVVETVGEKNVSDTEFELVKQ